MSAKKATQTANIGVTFYDGEFQVDFGCVGVEKCKFALCSFMPPTGDEECTFQEYGSCRRPIAQQAALEALRKQITKEIKRHENEEE